MDEKEKSTGCRKQTDARQEIDRRKDTIFPLASQVMDAVDRCNATGYTGPDTLFPYCRVVIQPNDTDLYVFWSESSSECLEPRYWWRLTPDLARKLIGKIEMVRKERMDIYEAVR